MIDEINLAKNYYVENTVKVITEAFRLCGAPSYKVASDLPRFWLKSSLGYFA